MKSYAVDGTVAINATVPEIRYNEIEFDTFKAREVTVDGVDIGEYHFQANGIECKNVIDIVRECTGSKECEVLDPENYLKLEYGIYFKINPDSMEAMNIDGVLNDINDKIKERFGK